MTLSYIETRTLIDLVLTTHSDHARSILNTKLNLMKRTEPELADGVIEHGKGMPYTPAQWFDLVLKVPNRLFRDERWLMNN